ncbi:sulfotransferase domain-containing protein [uncultured Pseudoalteromonas sp.]|uniref:sulfotransferase domain-containing protein n=1 Tax=uncultured Pseudoalteromonas sp. TaxID=114053 RepID=UPI002595D815|nr:sulfotransferase domain-containing protein [uncultured Pseudoalteromonas sp.]
MKNNKYPNLYIIGAPKCGTTSLANWLNNHKECFLPKTKEPHYFNDDDGHQMTKSLKDYLLLYDAKEPIKIDASVWYLFSKVAVKNIETVTDKTAKYIVCIRNPIEMVEALHAEQVLGGNENITNFLDAWNAQEIRKKGKNIKKSTHAASHLQYGLACKLGEQIERLLEKVDLDRVHFILLDDMRDYPEEVFKDVCLFLNIKEERLESYSKYNQSKTLKSKFVHKILLFLIAIKRKVSWLPSLKILSKIKNMNIEKGKRVGLSDDIKREILYPYFKEDIKKLENVLNKSLKQWGL